MIHAELNSNVRLDADRIRNEKSFGLLHCRAQLTLLPACIWNTIILRMQLSEGPKSTFEMFDFNDITVTIRLSFMGLNIRTSPSNCGMENRHAARGCVRF